MSGRLAVVIPPPVEENVKPPFLVIENRRNDTVHVQIARNTTLAKVYPARKHIQLLNKAEEGLAQKPGGDNHYVEMKTNYNWGTTSFTDKRFTDSWLVQFLGTTRRKPCTRCEAGHGPWTKCRTVEGLFDGTCGNCKKTDMGYQCNLSVGYNQVAKEAQKVVKQNESSTKVQGTSRHGRTLSQPAKYPK